MCTRQRLHKIAVVQALLLEVHVEKPPGEDSLIFFNIADFFVICNVNFNKMQRTLRCAGTVYLPKNA